MRLQNKHVLYGISLEADIYSMKWAYKPKKIKNQKIKNSTKCAYKQTNTLYNMPRGKIL